MTTIFSVSKTECLSCNNQILKSLGNLQGVFGAEIDRSEGRVIVSHTDEVSCEQISSVLTQSGFMDVKAELASDSPSIWGCAL